MSESVEESVLVQIRSVMGAIAMADARRDAVVVGEAEEELDMPGTWGDWVDRLRACSYMVVLPDREHSNCRWRVGSLAGRFRTLKSRLATLKLGSSRALPPRPRSS